MSRLRYNSEKFRFEGKTSDGRRLFAIDEDLIHQYQLDKIKEGGTIGPLLDAARWEEQIGNNPYVFFIDPLLEQIEEAERAEINKKVAAKKVAARQAKREQIRTYLQTHEQEHVDNRQLAKTLGTTHHQVRRVRREIEGATNG